MAQVPLNAEQLRSVEHQDGPLLVLAGAGSGKTRVITHRIARLVASGIPAKAICALTFTNKAALEMQERVLRLLGKKKTDLTVSTFHSFGLRVLSEERAHFGGAFSVFDQGDALGTVKEILRAQGLGAGLDAAAVLSRISYAKNAFVMPGDFAPRTGDEYDEVTALAYGPYQEKLRTYRAFDFDDLVCETVRLLSEKETVRDKWQARFRYVLVDEYQDTNRAQFEMLRLLVEAHKNVCAVGDDDQSIYAWRGADIRNILDFEAHFPGAKVVKLTQNYRSRRPILDVANCVIEKRTDAKYPKTLVTQKEGGKAVRAWECPSPEVEAKHTAKFLADKIREGIPLRELAVLYRSNAQGKLIEETLREEGISHHVIGGQQFFDRKEVKDVLCFLRVALNFSDEASLRRIVNFPPRGIGDKGLLRLSQHAVANNLSLFQAIERVDLWDDVPEPTREGCHGFVGLLRRARERFEQGTSPGDVLRSLLEEASVRDYVDGGKDPKRWANIEGLVGTFARWQKARKKPPTLEDVRGFLHRLVLDTSEQEEDPREAVTLSTLHGVKGLEFDVVVLIGCEEGYLPHTRTLESRVTDTTPQDIEEERRLFYVGVTRAREELVLSRAKARVLRGKPVPRTPSRFLADIPEELLEAEVVRDMSILTTSEMQQSAGSLLAMLDSLG